MFNQEVENGRKATEAEGRKGNTSNQRIQGSGPSPFAAPSISLPKGGGAIRGMGEKFAANPVTGTGSMTVPIAVTPGRSGFSPQLSLSYDSGSGNGAFGLGWNLSLPAITRKTDKGLPKYQDADESDVFILSGAEDLVPVLITESDQWRPDVSDHMVDGAPYHVRRYRPRIEGLFARIERWTNLDTGETHWRSISKDNITTFYGKTAESRIADPEDPRRVFSWLVCASYDDKGNAIVYEYQSEDSRRIFEDRQGQFVALLHERNRDGAGRSANRHLKRIKYGNRTPNRDTETWQATYPIQLPKETWMFEVVFDYGEGHYAEDTPDAQGCIFARPQIDSPAGSHWPVRQDPFSTYRAGFEVRTYRLCRRVLMFHHFPEELDTEDYLVRSTEFDYNETPITSFITSVTQSGYVRQGDGGYLKKSLPKLEFSYSEAAIQNEVQEVDAESLENLPYGLDGALYQWVDLDGEGVSGILTEQAGAWFYKRNLSPINIERVNGREKAIARFAPTEVIAQMPSLASISGGQQQLIDLAGDGQLDLAQFATPLSGFYERTHDGGWSDFRPFISTPKVDWNSPYQKFIDLTGDGHADILTTEDDLFAWYPSLAEEGFGRGERVHQPPDEERGPRLVFAEATQTIFLADISGDGLTDLVRIRNGEVCYWPNLGYGRFGAKVTMDNSPWFDAPDQFDPRRILLADIDGSGVTDIVYLGRDGVHLYFNQTGNSWGQPRILNHFPRVDNLSAVTAVDLLGNGTACLAWSSPLPGDACRAMRYIDLMGGKKPHLLVKVVNNLGAETHVQYAPSTEFYLADKLAGKPWATKLPFPVHVVKRVETYDRISRNRFVTRYAYHHGYFDGAEREFRGFVMVEQWDTEEIGTVGPEVTGSEDTNWDASSFAPPALTKTWFHTGSFPEDGPISKQFADEYYHEGDPSLGEGELSEDQHQAMLLPDTVLPEGLATEEAREACRSLKGAILRQEIYARDRRPDGTLSEESDRPYSVSERNYTIKRLQPRGDNKHAVFFTHARETVDLHYERKLYVIAGERRADPRVTHSATLDVDDYGNVLKAAAIGYGRRFDDPDPVLTAEDRDKQSKALLTLTENRYTNPVLLDDAYRSPLPCESRTYELVNVEPEAALPQITNLFRYEEIQTKAEAAGDGEHELPYEDVDHLGATEDYPYRRLIEHMRTRYRPDDLGASPNDDPNVLLPLGRLEALALQGESYKLALTPGLVQQIYVDTGKLAAGAFDNIFIRDGHYVHSKDDADWWVPSGRMFYSPGGNETAAQELAHARTHFFLPRRYRDPFHTNQFTTETVVSYDDHRLLVIETRDALDNTVRAQNDYRVLASQLMTDPNGNHSEVAFDALGMVVATAVRGKVGQTLGDLLEDLDPDPSLATLRDFVADPRGQAAFMLGKATTRIVYDLDRFKRSGQPSIAATLARETHSSDPGGAQTKIQISFSYSDGFGREIHKKIQAERGDAPQRGPNVILPSGDIQPGALVRDADGKPVQADTPQRWVGNGRSVFNNKGKPVKQYEPYFSSTHLYEEEREMTDTGVSAILFYDPLERVVATLHPNHTYEKVIFDPWRQETWDVNDTLHPTQIYVPRLPAQLPDHTFDPVNDPDVGGYFHRLAQTEYLPTWYDLRMDPNKAILEWPDVDPVTGDPKPENAIIRAAERQAAEKAARHASTPSVAYLDTLGRPFITIANNGLAFDSTSHKYETRVELDIEGNQRAVIDARGLVVMRYDYDMLGSHIHQNSMDAGKRWKLNNVAGKPIRAWDSRDHVLRTTYDELQRPTHLFVRWGNGVEVLMERTVYGEAYPDPIALNTRGKVYQHYGQAGVVTNVGRNPATDQDEAYDFKGNLLRGSRRLAHDYRLTVDWWLLADLRDVAGIAAAAEPLLETETFASNTTYDALNRPIQLIAPHSDQSGHLDVIRPGYNDANLLEKIDVWLQRQEEPPGLLEPDTADQHFVTNIDYNAKGQRVLIEYGNDVTTAYAYDANTFRLIHLQTMRSGAALQDLRYFYDPVGNITHIQDDADIQNTIYFRNQRVEPSADYKYDAIYRLIGATGREHLGQTGAQLNSPQQVTPDDSFRQNLLHPGDGNAMGNYTERYDYDEAGNILRTIHQANNGDWTRRYAYAPDSNRLLATSLTGGDPLGPYSATYEYDDHGNITRMTHLPLMRWDYRDQLQATSTQVINNSGTPEIIYYVYDAAGQRVRKVTERYANPGESATRKEERIYLGDFEVYRKYNGNGSTVTLERETLHIMDDKQRIALVETRTQGDDGSPKQLIRYQFSNHLGSASLELDGRAQIISYEEYYSYGSTSYQAVRSDVGVSPKRYRYTSKECDEESGLYYYGARYYAKWLGRWTTCDPIGIGAGINFYASVHNNPIVRIDKQGLQDEFENEFIFPHGAPRNETLESMAARLRREMGIPSPQGWIGAGEFIHRIDFTRWFPKSGNRLLVERLSEQMSDASVARRVNSQLQALQRTPHAVDESLILAVAYRESGGTIFSASPAKIDTYRRGGLDKIYSHLNELKIGQYLPRGADRNWEPVGGGAAMIPMNELIIAYGAEVNRARAVFLTHARRLGIDIGRLSPRALRAWTMIFFAAPGGLTYQEYLIKSSRPDFVASRNVGGITVLTHAQKLIGDNPALDWNTILLHEDLKGLSAPRTERERSRGYDIVQRGLVTAGEAEMLDRRK